MLPLPLPGVVAGSEPDGLGPMLRGGGKMLPDQVRLWFLFVIASLGRLYCLLWVRRAVPRALARYSSVRWSSSRPRWSIS
eukprot:11170901-Lingulodinium_polyedra.AAC.1